jgi:pyruvate carboxylase
VHASGGVVEGTICYTGDVSNAASSNKYSLDYYLGLAGELHLE